MDGREVIVHRVVNIVDKRSSKPRQNLDYDRGFHNEQWYGAPRNFPDERDFREDGNYPEKDCRYFEESHFGNFHRNPQSARNEGPHSQPYYGRDDLRHQLGSRRNGRPGPYFHQRGGGAPPPQSLADRNAKDDYMVPPPLVLKRDRSPIKRETQAPLLARLGSDSRSRSFSPEQDKAFNYQQPQQRHKPNLPPGHTPSSSVEAAPHSSASSKEKTPAAESKEVVTASMEPKPTPDEDFKARRSEAIKAKALEIEKDYRQDCETFRTVVKMLVDKEPSLENLLQAPLDKNLLEIKERCLDSLRHFVKELDEVLKQPDSSVQVTGQKGTA